MVKFARLTEDDRSNDEATKIVKSLFYISLSGTHAPLATRLKVIEDLLQSNDLAQQRLGIDALEAMLKTGHFLSVYNFEFGVRSRDFGYHPRTGKDVGDWFATVLDFARPFALLDGPVGQGIRHAIAHEFRGLWTNVSRTDELERISYAVAAKGFWREGWIGARQTRISDGDALPAQALSRLKALEDFLRPKDLLDKVRGVVLGAKGGRSIDLDDFYEVKNGDYAGAMARAAQTIETLGRDVAADDPSFKALLPELTEADNKTVSFGRGLALAAENSREMWRAMVTQMAAMAKPSIHLLGGFLNGLHARDSVVADAMLDESVEDPVLAEWLPILQTFVVIDDKGVARLHRALALGSAPIHAYYNLACGRASDGIPGPEFKRLVLAINAKSDGNRVAMEILSMRLYSDGADKKLPDREVVDAGRALLASYEFQRTGSHAHEDHQLGVIIRASLAGNQGKPIVRQLCQRFLASAANHSLSAFEYGDLMAGLFQVHPDDVLDELARGDKNAQSRSAELIAEFAQFGKSPMDAVPDSTVIAWCDRDPKARYPFAAAIVPLFDQTNNENPHGWKNIARTLLLNASEKDAVFKPIARRLYPTGGVGSLSSQHESRLKLLDQLDLSGLPTLALPLAKVREALEEEVDVWRGRETERDRARSSRFE